MFKFLLNQECAGISTPPFVCSICSPYQTSRSPGVWIRTGLMSPRSLSGVQDQELITEFETEVSVTESVTVFLLSLFEIECELSLSLSPGSWVGYITPVSSLPLSTPLSICHRVQWWLIQLSAPPICDGRNDACLKLTGARLDLA